MTNGILGGTCEPTGFSARVINVMMKTRVAIAASLILIGTALVGCSLSEFLGDDESSRTNGPLERPADEGGVGMYVPRSKPSTWTGSFGSLPLCLKSEGQEVQVIEVKALKTSGAVHNFEAFVAHRIEGAKGDLLFGSALGRPPTFKGYRRGIGPESPYTYEDLGAPVTVQGTCDDVKNAANLVLSFDTNHKGGAVSSWEVRYESDGVEYSTGPVPWEVWLCGDALGPQFPCE